MPAIKVQHVVSCSSEDRVHSAENLLVSDHYRKWKSAQVGEKQVTVVLQFEKSSVIHSIDIGNEGSAFVEILVGRSSDSNPSYEVLLVASSFMTALESRQGTNTNRVRMFGSEKLSLTVSKEKWDLIKVVCTQPFNKTTQYGLSFVVFHSPPIKTEVENSNSDSQTKIGAFKVKSTDDSENDISVGSWFAKRKSDSQDIDKQSTVSVIKSTILKSTSDSASSSVKKSKPSPDDTCGSQSTSTNGTASKTKNVTPNHRLIRDSPETVKKLPKINLNLTPNTQTSKAAHVTGGSSTPNAPVKTSALKPSSAKAVNKTGDRGATQSKVNSSKPSKKLAKNTRPFHKLMVGTVFVLSGYQNPQRGNIRDKAVEMGAVYKPDWDKQCTHLICAFLNTPKYQEVHRKGGRIVTEKWILECYKQKTLIPWRQFLLGKPNRPITSESDCSSTEDEIDQTHQTKINIVQKGISKSVPEKNKPNFKDKPAQRKTSTSNELTKSVSEDEILDLVDKAESSRSMPVSRSSVDGNGDSDAIYEADTDLDSDSGCDTESEIKKVIAKNKLKEDIANSKADTSKLGLPELPDIFKGEHFYLFGTFNDAEKKELCRYIIGCGGVIEEYMNNKVLYVLTYSKWNQDFTDAIRDNSSIRIMKPFWVTESIQSGKLLPKKDYFVSKR